MMRSGSASRSRRAIVQRSSRSSAANSAAYSSGEKSPSATSGAPRRSPAQCCEVIRRRAQVHRIQRLKISDVTQYKPHRGVRNGWRESLTHPLGQAVRGTHEGRRACCLTHSVTDQIVDDACKRRRLQQRGRRWLVGGKSRCLELNAGRGQCTARYAATSLAAARFSGHSDRVGPLVRRREASRHAFQATGAVMPRSSRAASPTATTTRLASGVAGCDE